MPDTFMRQVLCPTCPDENGPRVQMRFAAHKGPYDRWFDDRQKRTITKAEVGSRCVREFWYCEKCSTTVWFDFLVDKRREDVPQDVWESMRRKYARG